MAKYVWLHRSEQGFDSIESAKSWLDQEKNKHEWVLMQALVQSEMMRVPLDTGGDSPPSAAVQVARCMVILV